MYDSVMKSGGSGADGEDGQDAVGALLRQARLLGLWQGPSITLPAAAALLGQPETATADALETLVDAQLLRSPAADRYQLHDLLKAYASDRCAADVAESDQDEAVRRLLTWYLHAVVAADQVVSPHRDKVPLEPPEPWCRPPSFRTAEQALAWSEAERASIVAAVQQAAGHGLHDISWKIPVTSIGFFNRRACWEEWLITHRVAVESARQLADQRAVAWVLLNLGMLYGHLRMPEAIGYLEQALAIRRSLGDQPGVGQAANNLADAYVRLNRSDEALDPLRLALRIFREIGHRRGEGISLENLGELYLNIGRTDEAIRSLRQAHEIFSAIGELRGEGYAQHNLGQALLGSGRPDEALDHLRSALKLRRSTGDRREEAETLSLLGTAQRDCGLIAETREYWAAAITLFEALEEPGRAAELRAKLAAPGPAPAD